MRFLGAAGRLFLKLDDAAIVCRNDDTVLIDIGGFDQTDRCKGMRFAMKGDQRIEVRVGEVVAADDDERLGEKRLELL